MWEKLFNLADHSNYKIGIFALYIIQKLFPRDNQELLNLISYRVEKLNHLKKEIISKSESYQQCTNNFVSLKIRNTDHPTGNDYFLSPEQVLNLQLFIKERIIYEYKLKTMEKVENNYQNFPTLYSNEERDITDRNAHLMGVNGEINNYGKLNEDMDIDLIKIPELNDQIVNSEQQEKEDAETLEELGVFEAEDEIFENFDEENIPVLKNMYRRKKGSAEKLKTNQNARNLLMSNQNNNSNYNKRENSFKRPSNNYSREREMVREGGNSISSVNNRIYEENKRNSFDKLDEQNPEMQLKKSNFI
jgi:hypothetical protein